MLLLVYDVHFPYSTCLGLTSTSGKLSAPRCPAAVIRVYTLCVLLDCFVSCGIMSYDLI